MKPMIRILSLSALVIAAVIAALYFALPSNQLDISFPQSAKPGIGTPSPLGASDANHIAPPVLSATGGPNSITISWQAVPDAATYEIWGRLGEATWTQIDDGTLTGSATSWVHSGLTAGDTYFYTGRTVPASGTKSAWAVQTTATALDATSVPSLALTPGYGKIDLSWNAVTGAENYHLITWTDGQTDWQRIGDPITGTFTAYTHSDLTSETTYHYRVRAVIDGTERDWSASVSAAPIVPPAPTLTATAGTGHVDLAWSPVTGADSYQLVMWNHDLEDWDRIGDPITHTATAYTHSDLEPDHTYFYSVKAVIDDIEGDWATTISAIPMAPAAPTLTATTAAGEVALSWNAVAGAESYHLIYWTDAQNDWLRIGDPLTATTTSFTHSALTSGQVYYYQVSAVLKNVEGPWSNGISAVLATATIPGLIATEDNGQVKLNWSAVPGAESYHLITWTEGQADWTRIGDPLSASTTSYTHSGPTAGVTYYYRVRAVVNGANGDWSEQVDITP